MKHPCPCPLWLLLLGFAACEGLTSVNPSDDEGAEQLTTVTSSALTAEKPTYDPSCGPQPPAQPVLPPQARRPQDVGPAADVGRPVAHPKQVLPAPGQNLPTPAVNLEMEARYGEYRRQLAQLEPALAGLNAPEKERQRAALKHRVVLHPELKGAP